MSAPFFREHRFYPALLALTLMLGKFVPVEAATVPEPTRLAAIATRPASAATTPARTTADKDIRAAFAAFEARDVKALAAIKDRVSSSHPLAAYPQYWWLVSQLGLASNFGVTNAADIRAFLTTHADSVVADGLRREWLKALGKMDKWELFDAEFPLLNAEDNEITCHQWRHRLDRNERSALTEAKAFWSTARLSPAACDDVFARLATEKMLPPAEAWSRVRTFLENNQLADARKSALLIPGIPASFERTTAIVGQNPAAYLQREKVQANAPASVELYLFAITRLARSDADRAARLLETNGKNLPADASAYAWAQIGLYASMQHDAAAGAWFARAGKYPLNDNQAAWKARAALRAGDWPSVTAAIQAMSVSEQRDAAWRYWSARAVEAGGNSDAARALRTPLARENNFYGVLAAEELGLPQTPHWQGWKPTAAAIDGVSKRPAIARALAFYRIDMRNEGLREWVNGIRSMDDEQLLAAAEAARMASVPDRAINTAEKTLVLHDLAQRYPTPHQADLTRHARVQGLDEAWIYGLIRQESRFMTDAKSRVGAMGLMQLMPATATWAAKKVNLVRFSPANAIDVPINLNLGSFYLRHVLDDLGHPVLATAGYNAGPGRARRWRSTLPLEGAIYAESIPFNETRDYVKKVMVNTWYYAQQAGETKRKLKEMMGVVPGSREGGTGLSSLVAANVKEREAK